MLTETIIFIDSLEVPITPPLGYITNRLYSSGSVIKRSFYNFKINPYRICLSDRSVFDRLKGLPIEVAYFPTILDRDDSDDFVYNDESSLTSVPRYKEMVQIIERLRS